MLLLPSRPAANPSRPGVRPAVQVSGMERRTSRRHTCLATHQRLTATVGDTFVLAKIRNISAEGISLIMSRPVEAGSILSVDLIDTKTDQFSRTLQVKVVYSVEHPNGDWIMGGSFSSRLSDAEVRQFLALA
jgi:hypothetical protein